MKSLILELIQIVLICYLNGFLIKLAIEEFKDKHYVFFGAYLTLIIAGIGVVLKFFLFTEL